MNRVAISLSVNSNLYAISGMIVMDLSPHHGSYFPVFCILHRFLLHPDIVNFTLLDASIFFFCIFFNILQLFSMIHLSYLEMYHILPILF